MAWYTDESSNNKWMNKFACEHQLNTIFILITAHALIMLIEVHPLHFIMEGLIQDSIWVQRYHKRDSHLISQSINTLTVQGCWVLSDRSYKYATLLWSWLNDLHDSKQTYIVPLTLQLPYIVILQ